MAPNRGSDFSGLPANSETFAKLTWPEIEPYFTDLESRHLVGSTLQPWLRDWTILHALISESYSRLHVDLAGNTEDESARGRFHDFVEKVYLASQPFETRLKRKLIDSGLKPELFDRPLENMKAEADLHRDENLPLLAEEEKLGSEYDKIVGAQTVEWDGEEITLSKLSTVYQESDRDRREEAWRLASERQLADREAINDLWTKFMPLRRKLASNAGFDAYRDFRWRQMLRFDYSPADCFRFHEAIEKDVVPAATAIYEKRRKRLYLAKLRPWDLDVDPLSRKALRPFESAETLEEKAAAIFNKVDSELGDYFNVMREEGLLDLANRKGKAPGGFCTFFAAARKPFIFMNAVGLHRDVKTLLHEAGHAFHAFEVAALPYHQQWDYGMEFAEVASMSMELLGSPFLTDEGGGFYSAQDAARARTEHLEKIILFWPYMAVVDAFQHWVYEHHDAATNPSHCDKKWAELWQRFIPGIDYTGLEQDLATGWHRKLHIHQIPFYYVEYGLAQLGAIQVWANSLKDRAAAVASYREALAKGSAPLRLLYRTAGAEFSFGGTRLKGAVKLILTTLDQLKAASSH